MTGTAHRDSLPGGAMASQDPNAPVADVESAMAARVDPARNGPASLARAWVRGVVAVGVLVVVAVLGFQATRPTYSSGDFMQHAPVTTASGTAPRQLAAASWIDRLFGLDRKAAASFPLVTVMVVTRNRPHFLAHAVFNIMQQGECGGRSGVVAGCDGGKRGGLKCVARW